MQIICAYGPQSGRPEMDKVCFYDEMASEWDKEVLSKSSFSWGILMGLWENMLRVLKVCMGRIKLERKCGRMKLLEFYDEKELCMITRFQRDEKRNYL